MGASSLFLKIQGHGDRGDVMWLHDGRAAEALTTCMPVPRPLRAPTYILESRRSDRISREETLELGDWGWGLGAEGGVCAMFPLAIAGSSMILGL